MTNKFVFLTMFLSASTITAMPARAANVEWRGHVLVKTASAACATYAGAIVPVRFRPSGLGDNGANSKFAFHENWFAHAYKIAGRFATTYKAVAAGSVGAGWGSFADDGITAQVALTVTPTNYAATTASLALSGGIRNFGDTSGCNVTFAGSVDKMP